MAFTAALISFRHLDLADAEKRFLAILTGSVHRPAARRPKTGS